MRFRAAEVDAWLEQQQATAKWEAYRQALAAGKGVSAAAAKLALSRHDIELHQLVLREDARLAELANDIEQAQTEMREAHRFPRMDALGTVFTDCALRQDQANARIQKARTAVDQRDVLRAQFPRVFGLPPNPNFLPHVARYLLPQAVRQRLDAIDQAERDALLLAEEETEQTTRQSVLPWWENRKTDPNEPHE